MYQWYPFPYSNQFSRCWSISCLYHTLEIRVPLSSFSTKNSPRHTQSAVHPLRPRSPSTSWLWVSHTPRLTWSRRCRSTTTWFCRRLLMISCRTWDISAWAARRCFFLGSDFGMVCMIEKYLTRDFSLISIDSHLGFGCVERLCFCLLVDFNQICVLWIIYWAI